MSSEVDVQHGAGGPIVSIIAAMARNRVIGRDGGLPWKIPEDMQFFKRTTSGHPVIMGRKTFATDAGLLPNRTNIILTRRQDFTVDGAVVCHTLEEALRPYAGRDEEVFIIGGAEIYRMFLPRADRIYLTVIEADFDGDTYFPDFEWEDYEERWREDFSGPMHYWRVLLARAS